MVADFAAFVASDRASAITSILESVEEREGTQQDWTEMIFLYMAAQGSGDWSLDALIRRRRHGATSL